MKKTVKAWIRILDNRYGTPCLTSISDNKEEAHSTISDHGFNVVPCTINYTVPHGSKEKKA